MKGATKVLKAAALTYVASLFSSILQFLRLLILTQGNGRRRRINEKVYNVLNCYNYGSWNT